MELKGKTDRELKAWLKVQNETIREHQEHLQQVVAKFDVMFQKLFAERAKREAAKAAK